MTMHIDLTGKTALITGASRGVGRAAALALRASGARCVALARDAAALDALASADAGITALTADLRDHEGVNSALDVFNEPIDMFVHCAAPMFDYVKIDQLTDEATEAQLDVGLRAPLWLCQRLLPGMMTRRWGRIVLIGSIAASRGIVGSAHYNMVKAAQESLSRSIALEYGRHGVCANTLTLGPIDGERLAIREQEHPGARTRLIQDSPLKRLPTDAQVADIITFFCSDYAAPINGATLDITCAAHLSAR